MGRDAAYYAGLVVGLIGGAIASAEVLHVGGFPQVLLSVVAGLVVARIFDRAYQKRQLARRMEQRLYPGAPCPRCGNARVGRYCSRCGTPMP
jgi:hypothetical protein